MPGVGKSAIAHRLGQRLGNEGIAVAQPSYELAHGISRARRVARKLAIVGSETLRSPGLVWRSFQSVRSTGQRQSTVGSLKTIFNWILVAALARRAREYDGVSLFDEGLFQGLWSLGLEGDLAVVEALVSRLPELAPLPDYLIVSQASAGTVESRVRSRADNNSRLDVRIDSEPDLIQRGLETLDAIHSRTERDLESIRVLVLSNETQADLEHNVGVLADLIAQRGD